MSICSMMRQQEYPKHSKKILQPWLIPEDLAAKVKKYKRGILLIAPHLMYPTGISTSMERRDEIMRITANADIPVIEIDDARVLDINTPPSYYMMDKRNSTIYVGSFSRAFTRLIIG